jgi:hypothetical protein
MEGFTIYTQPTNRQVSTDRYMSEPELRTYLGYSPSTMSRLRNKGLPCVGTGRLRRYHVSTVLQWLAQHV